MKFKFWTWKNGHHRSCMCDECTANIREAAKSIDPWPVPDIGKESFCGPGDWTREISRRTTINLENGETVESVRMRINEADKQRKEKQMSKKKMSRHEAGNAANDWANASHAGLGVVHDEERNQYSVGFQGMHSLAEFPYAPEPEPIKNGVLCVATDMHGGVIIGRASGKKSQLGGTVIELFADAPGAPPLEKVRPVTLADLIAWGHEVDTFNTCDSMCQTCLHVNVKATSEPCKSCETTMGTNYEKGGIDGH